MTPTRLSNALAVLRWGPTDLADEINVNERTVRRWLVGQNETPEWVLEWLETLAAFHEAHPAPMRTETTPQPEAT